MLNRGARAVTGGEKKKHSTDSQVCCVEQRCPRCKRPFKDTILKDCIFATACQQHKGLTLLTFSDVVMKWLRYAPEREGGIPRKKN
ncbi:hypothetical protein SRHO_G00247180 [Serrasalmus rhombeus]